MNALEIFLMGIGIGMAVLFVAWTAGERRVAGKWEVETETSLRPGEVFTMITYRPAKLIDVLALRNGQQVTYTRMGARLVETLVKSRWAEEDG